MRRFVGKLLRVPSVLVVLTLKIMECCERFLHMTILIILLKSKIVNFHITTAVKNK
jgi:hypothetical protein